jgi:hypothetical protein
MGNVAFFTSIIIIASGILQIVLLFKVWEMTNDVRQIKEKQERHDINELIKEAQASKLKGDEEKAIELYEKAFFSSISHLYNEVIGGYPTWAAECWSKRYPKIVRYYQTRKISSDFTLDFNKYDSLDKVKNMFK